MKNSGWVRANDSPPKLAPAVMNRLLSEISSLQLEGQNSNPLQLLDQAELSCSELRAPISTAASCRALNLSELNAPELSSNELNPSELSSAKLICNCENSPMELSSALLRPALNSALLSPALLNAAASSAELKPKLLSWETSSAELNAWPL